MKESEAAEPKAGRRRVVLIAGLKIELSVSGEIGGEDGEESGGWRGVSGGEAGAARMLRLPEKEDSAESIAGCFG